METESGTQEGFHTDRAASSTIGSNLLPG